MKSKQECYGKMFPSVVGMTHEQSRAGRVFGYKLDYLGQVAQLRAATVDREAWQKCVECRDLDGCFRLSEGTMLMELALRTTPESLY